MMTTATATVTDDRARMEELGQLHICYATHKAWPLLNAALDAGQPLPASFVAVLRRTAMLAYWQVEKEQKKMIAGLTEPVLNPGEAWSDPVSYTHL